MNWKALKDGKCPKCDGLLHDGHFANVVFCDCGFKIGIDKLKSIIERKPQAFESEITDEERHAQWNNYRQSARDPDEPYRKW